MINAVTANTRLYVRNEYKRDRVNKQVSKQQSMYFIVNNLVIPKQLVGGNKNE